MKTFVFGIIFLVLSLIIFGFECRGCIKAHYEYETEIGNYFELSDRSSTLEAKADYINKYVEALKKSKHADHDAIFFKTPANNFDNNFKALITLRDRLKTIKKMDERSFAYQTAMQQITAQEHGEAQQMNAVFKGCWELENYPCVWDFYLAVLISVGFILMTIAICCIGVGINNL